MKNGRILRQKLMNVGRKIQPPRLKQQMKTAIRPAVNRAARMVEESPEALKEKFSEIHEKNIFGGRISRSGEGSDLVQTEIIRRELPKIVEQYSIRTFLDAPCGDWYWMRETDLGVEHYIGVDIVETMIENTKLWCDPAAHDGC